MNAEQYEKIAHATGFVAALDQSGGSTPRALSHYGIQPDAWSSDDEMFDLIHAMRTRVMTAPAFNGDKILAAILFEQTMDREVAGRPTPEYLWEERGIVPIVKVDQGLEAEVNGSQLMKEMDRLDGLLERAKAKGVFGTKMRSVIKHADVDGIAANVAQQFYYGGRILDAGLMPILEPEIDIRAEDKVDCERILKDNLLEFLSGLDDGRQVMLKLTPPEQDDFYADVIAHPGVLRVVALSGGWSRDEACARLARNHGLIASFSRALLEGLQHDQSDEEFNATLTASIDQVYEASAT
jgi:fructose-bisphosphate aldolase class I